MALVGVQGARVIDAAEPFEQDRVGVVRGEAQVTLGHGDAGARPLGLQDLLQLDQPPLDPVPQLPQLLPRPLRLALVAVAAEHAVRPARQLLHHVDGDQVEMLARALDHVPGPERGSSSPRSPQPISRMEGSRPRIALANSTVCAIASSLLNPSAL